MEIRRFQKVGAIFTEDLSNLQFVRNRYTVNGNPTIANSPYGKAMSFDGTNDDIMINENISTEINNISFIANVKWDGADGESQYFLANGSTGGDGYAFRLHSTDYISVICGGVGSANALNDSLAVGEWTSLAFIRDSGTWKIYKNGTILSVTGNPTPNALTTQRTNIASNDNLAQSFNGAMKNVVFYERALTAQEILDIHNGVAFDYEKNVVSEWDMSSYNPFDIGWRNNGNNGTGSNMGSTNIVNGIGGGTAQEFNGSNELITIVNDSSLSLGTVSYSLSCWIKTIDTSNQDVISKWAGAGGYPYTIRVITGGEARFAIYDGSISVNADSSIVVADGIWHHIVGTKSVSNNEVCIYVDGVLRECVSDTTISSLDNDIDFVIGARGDNSVWFDGIIDKVIVFNKALTNLEINDLYNKQLEGRR